MEEVDFCAQYSFTASAQGYWYWYYVHVYETQLHMGEAFMHMPCGVVGDMHTSLLLSGTKFHAQCMLVGEEHI